MSGDSECPGSTQFDKLCDLMIRLKVENPELGRKGMLTAVQAEGPEWKKVEFEQIKRTWKKMMKQNSKDREEIATANQNGLKEKNKKSTDRGQSAVMKQSSKDDEKAEIGASNAENSKEQHKESECGGQPEAPCASSRSPALEKQLEMRESKKVTYVLFTPPSDGADYSIQLSNPIGEVFFNVMWNRAVEAPWGSPKIKREMWMIFQQLEFSLSMKYKKLLRKQLQTEFGVDPFDGRN